MRTRSFRAVCLHLRPGLWHAPSSRGACHSSSLTLKLQHICFNTHRIYLLTQVWDPDSRIGALDITDFRLEVANDTSNPALSGRIPLPQQGGVMV